MKTLTPAERMMRRLGAQKRIEYVRWAMAGGQQPPAPTANAVFMPNDDAHITACRAAGVTVWEITESFQGRFTYGQVQHRAQMLREGR